jgi:predicted  nucleic acid-binding Zn-ribbon protein
MSIEFYQQIEAQHGKDIATSIASLYASTADAIEERALEVADHKKVELREELRSELASKADLALTKAELQGEMKELRGEIKALREEMRGEFKAVREEMKTLRAELDLKIERLDRKFTLLLMLVLFSIILTNQDTITFLLKVFGVLK